MDIIKLAESIEMSIAIPDSEIGLAQKTVTSFRNISKKFDAFNNLLDKIYIPFSNEGAMSKDNIQNYRSAIWNYREELKKLLSELKGMAIICVKDLGFFSSDMEITELLGSFSDGIGLIDDDMKVLTESLENWDDDDFRANVVKSIENLKKNIHESRNLINDRIISHINSNILSKNWTDEISKELNINLNDKEPVIKELYKEREEKLKQLLY